MEGETSCAGVGNERVQLNGKMVQSFQRSFVQVEKILDQNRLLINEINQNHESSTPHNLTRNVALIRQLNNNITRVVHLYAHLSTSFTKSIHAFSQPHDFNFAPHKRHRPA